MSADPILVAALDAVDAQLELLRVQMIGVRQRLNTLLATEQARVELSLPDRCEGHPSHRCGLQDDTARISLGNLREPGKWQCRGCREITIDGLSDIADS